jgi:hypothetical protein
VLLATLVVAGIPVALVWVLRSTGLVVSFPVSVLVGVGASLSLSQAGCRLWERYPHSEDLLFSELMLWGYIRRRRTQRQLASAVRILGPIRDPSVTSLQGLNAKQRVRTLESLVSSVETRDPYLHGHSRRVARHSWMIAKRMGLAPTEIARIRTAAAVHDIGKINTPASVLQKPAALTDAEYAVIQRHPGEGAEMSKVLEDDALTSIIRHHHERLDGSGYPDHLRGEEIPLGARIIAVADTFDAITSARPYRETRPHSAALEILKGEAGSKLDAAVVRTFCAHYSGRRCITLSAVIGSVPERLVSLLEAGIESTASVAKLVVASAVIGGAAATSSALGLPVSAHRPAPVERSQTSKPAGAVAGSQAIYVKRQPTRDTAVSPQRKRPVLRAVAAARHVQKAATSVTAAAALSPEPSRTAVSIAASSPAASGATSAARNPVTSSPTASSVKTGSPREGAHSHGPETTAAETGTTNGRSEEAHGKSEEAHGKSEEAHGKSEEAHGKSEEAHGKSEEAHGKSEEAHGNSEEAHGKSEEAQGRSKEAAAGAESSAHGE